MAKYGDTLDGFKKNCRLTFLITNINGSVLTMSEVPPPLLS